MLACLGADTCDLKCDLAQASTSLDSAKSAVHSTINPCLADLGRERAGRAMGHMAGPSSARQNGPALKRHREFSQSQRRDPVVPRAKAVWLVLIGQVELYHEGCGTRLAVVWSTHIP